MRTAVRDAEFSAFMRAASPSLLRTAWLLTADPEAAQELVQAALVKTYVAWPRVRTDEAVAYARRILVNERTDAWRRRTREAPPPDAALPETGRSDPALARVEVRDELVHLLQLLPQRQRAAVVLRHYHDLSEAQTAEAMGISVGAVKSATSRGLATLRAALATNRTAEGSRS